MTNKIFLKVLKRLDLLLVENGFSGNETYWRDRGWALDCIDFQQSGNTDANLKFTLNVGVLIPEIHELIWGAENPPSNASCQLRLRIGNLINPGQRDHWWTVRTSSGLDATIEELSNSLVEKVFPFFNKVKTLEDLSSMMDIMPEGMRSQLFFKLNKLVVEARLKRPFSASAQLQEIINDNRAVGWHSRAENLAAKLGI